VTGDRIELRDLRVVARCGVLEIEQAQDQPLAVDLDIWCDLRSAGLSDDLRDTVDYGAVCRLVDVTLRSRPVALLEHAAEQVAAAVLGHDERVEEVRVNLRKLRPPVPHDLGTSGVRITRRRDR
jgi:dihydroneopterin aldolase